MSDRIVPSTDMPRGVGDTNLTPTLEDENQPPGRVTRGFHESHERITAPEFRDELSRQADESAYSDFEKHAKGKEKDNGSYR